MKKRLLKMGGRRLVYKFQVVQLLARTGISFKSGIIAKERFVKKSWVLCLE